MLVFRNEVSHQWDRRHSLGLWKQGAITTDSLCDADFLLVAAARFHGEPAHRPCPICEDADLRTVYWVYGDELGRASGSARSLEEIGEFAAQGKEFTVHTVEVCAVCKWNHLLRSVTAVDNGEDMDKSR